MRRYTLFQKPITTLLLVLVLLVSTQIKPLIEYKFTKYFFAANIAQKYHVNKYPTMKLFRGGQLVKREYRGQRSAESLANFIKDQLKDPIKEFHSLDEVYELSVLCLNFYIFKVLSH